MILEEFGLFSQESRMVNDHTPVKTGKGESPIRGGGLLFVIDGALCEAYQKKTETAGYSLDYFHHEDQGIEKNAFSAVIPSAFYASLK